jgi:hypothetical protein
MKADGKHLSDREIHLPAAIRLQPESASRPAGSAILPLSPRPILARNQADEFRSWN